MKNEEFNEKIDKLIDIIGKGRDDRYTNKGLCFYINLYISDIGNFLAKYIEEKLRKLPYYNEEGSSDDYGVWRFPAPHNSNAKDWYAPRIEWLKSLKK